MIDVSTVIVSHNCRDWLRKCLESVSPERAASDSEVVVVDNASSDGTPDLVRREFPWVSLVENAENVGFARANNQAIERCAGRYVFLLNPDAIALPQAISEMVAFMDEHPDVGIVGPRLLNPDRSLQHSIRNFPTIGNQCFEGLFLHRLMPKLTERYGEVVLDERAYERRRDVDWLCGAALLARADVIDRVGPLDESFFMYSEEMDWCYRIREAGYRVVFNPRAQVIHRSGVGRDPLLYELLVASRLQFLRLHTGLGVVGLARIVMAASMCLRIVIWSARGLLAPGAGAARTVRAYARGLGVVMSSSTR